MGAFAQNRTVYIVKNDSLARPKPVRNDNFLDEFSLFGQAALSTPLRFNPDYGKTNDSDEDAATCLLPDGLSIHGGFGVHLDQALALTVNSGFDWHADANLFSVPVYASALLNIRLSDENSFMLQYGYGRAFAIGHGHLAGTYEKLRVAYVIDIVGIFAEINQYGYAWKDAPEMSGVNLGIQVFVFE